MWLCVFKGSTAISSQQPLSGMLRKVHNKAHRLVDLPPSCVRAIQKTYGSREGRRPFRRSPLGGRGQNHRQRHRRAYIQTRLTDKETTRQTDQLTYRLADWTITSNEIREGSRPFGRSPAGGRGQNRTGGATSLFRRGGHADERYLLTTNVANPGRHRQKLNNPTFDTTECLACGGIYIYI